MTLQQYNPIVKPIWVTPNAEQMIIDMARVSSDRPPGTPGRLLLQYLIDNKHWSPFEMANVCFELTGIPRDISRQLLRHDIHVQEFSQRYADVAALGSGIERECRMQDPKNRQKSIPCEDEETAQWWLKEHCELEEHATRVYAEALERGIAKEVARVVLPEGMTPSKLYANGTVRNWIHYCWVRWDGEGVQDEHRELAGMIGNMMYLLLPVIATAAFGRKDY